VPGFIEARHRTWIRSEGPCDADQTGEAARLSDSKCYLDVRAAIAIRIPLAISGTPRGGRISPSGLLLLERRDGSDEIFSVSMNGCSGEAGRITTLTFGLDTANLSARESGFLRSGQ